MHFLAAAGEDDVLLAHLDQLIAVADAMGAGGTGGTDGVGRALDLERGAQAGRRGTAHGPRHHIRSDAADALAAQDIGGVDQIAGGGAAGADDQTSAGVGHLFGRQGAVRDRFGHGHIGEGRGVPHEPHHLAVDEFGGIHADGAVDVAAQAQFGIFGAGFDPRPALAQGVNDFVDVVADAGYGAEACDDNAFHNNSP